MDAIRQLPAAEIRGRNWTSLAYQMLKIFIIMIKEAGKRRKSYPKGQSPWSDKIVYLSVNIRLGSKEDE
jgi:hypothetical protein